MKKELEIKPAGAIILTPRKKAIKKTIKTLQKKITQKREEDSLSRDSCNILGRGTIVMIMFFYKSTIIYEQLKIVKY